MKPSCSTLPSSSWLVATVVPWQTAVTSAPVAPSRSRTLCTPLMKPSAGLAGVEGVLVVMSAPESSSKATTSVNVPPVSMPMRMRRGVCVMAFLGRERRVSGGSGGAARDGGVHDSTRAGPGNRCQNLPRPLADLHAHLGYAVPAPPAAPVAFASPSPSGRTKRPESRPGTGRFGPFGASGRGLSDLEVREGRGGGALEVLAVVADQVQVAVGEVVESLAHAGSGRERGQRLVRVEPGAHPALVGCRLGGDVRDGRDDVGVAEVEHPRRVGAGGVGADDVDMVVVRPGPAG